MFHAIFNCFNVLKGKIFTPGYFFILVLRAGVIVRMYIRIIAAIYIKCIRNINYPILNSLIY